MKKLHSLLFLLALPLVATATGLNFVSGGSPFGDVLTSSGGSVSDSATVRYGTLTGNANFATADAAYSTFGQYESAFTQIGTGAASGGNVTASVGAGNIAPSQNLWLLVEDGGEQGAFYLGSTPDLNVLLAAPTFSLVGIGADDGINVRLAAVPEPSTFAALSGLFALAWVLVRRRG